MLKKRLFNEACPSASLEINASDDDDEHKATEYITAVIAALLHQ
jgi:hypothetical protein